MTAALNTCEALLLHMEGQARPIASAPPFTAVWYMGLQDSRYWRWALRAQQCCCCCHGHTAAAITRESGIYGSSICFFPSDHMQLTSAGRAWGADRGGCAASIVGFTTPTTRCALFFPPLFRPGWRESGVHYVPSFFVLALLTQKMATLSLSSDTV